MNEPAGLRLMIWMGKPLSPRRLRVVQRRPFQHLVGALEHRHQLQPNEGVGPHQRSQRVIGGDVQHAQLVGAEEHPHRLGFGRP